MTLLSIRDYMSQVKLASLQHLCGHFNTSPETIRCLLRHFIGKGKIRQCMRQPACGTKCFKCPVAVTEIYEWVDCCYTA